MKQLTRLTCLVALLATYMLLTGCASISVNYDYDTSADFSQYKSYSWRPSSEDDVAGGAPHANNGLLSTRIEKSVEVQMKARGIKKSSGEGDLSLVYHFGSTDKIQVTDWGYNYSGYYGHRGWGYGGHNIDVYQYREGTLVVDMVDSATNNLVWRGSGTGVISSGQKSPEDIQAKIDNAIAEIMASFPPKN